MMNSLFTTISNTLDDDVVKSFKLYLDEFAILVVPVWKVEVIKHQLQVVKWFQSIYIIEVSLIHYNVINSL